MSRSTRLRKLIDYSVGIPLVVVLGAVLRAHRWILNCFASESTEVAVVTSPTSIAVLCVAAIGDLLILSAPLRDLKKSCPHVQIALFCGPDNKSMADILNAQFRLFTEIIVTLPTRPIKTYMDARRRHFDVVIDAGQWSRWSALLACCIPARLRIGFRTRKQYRHFGFDLAVAHGSDLHELENYRSLFSIFHIDKMSAPRLFASSASNVIREPYIVLHMFASGNKAYLKEWPVKNWIALAQWAQSKHYRVVLTGSPADAIRCNTEIQSIESVGYKAEILNQIGKLNLAATSDLLAHAKLVVSVNTGIMHIADALDVPVIGIHGPTNAKRWGPWSNQARIVRANLPCSPCLHLGFDYGCNVNSCMREISVDQVVEVAERCLPLHDV